MAFATNFDQQLDPPLTLGSDSAALDRPSEQLDHLAAVSAEHHLVAALRTHAVWRWLDGDAVPPVGGIDLDAEQLESAGLLLREDDWNLGDLRWVDARGEVDADLDVDMAMHIIQGPLISQRIVDDSEVSDSDLERMLDMTIRALGAHGIDHEQ